MQLIPPTIQPFSAMLITSDIERPEVQPLNAQATLASAIEPIESLTYLPYHIRPEVHIGLSLVLVSIVIFRRLYDCCPRRAIIIRYMLEFIAITIAACSIIWNSSGFLVKTVYHLALSPAFTVLCTSFGVALIVLGLRRLYRILMVQAPRTQATRDPESPSTIFNINNSPSPTTEQQFQKLQQLYNEQFAQL